MITSTINHKAQPYMYAELKDTKLVKVLDFIFFRTFKSELIDSKNGKRFSQPKNMATFAHDVCLSEKSCQRSIKQLREDNWIITKRKRSSKDCGVRINFYLTDKCKNFMAFIDKKVFEKIDTNNLNINPNINTYTDTDKLSVSDLDKLSVSYNKENTTKETNIVNNNHPIPEKINKHAEQENNIKNNVTFCKNDFNINSDLETLKTNTDNKNLIADDKFINKPKSISILNLVRNYAFKS